MSKTANTLKRILESLWFIVAIMALGIAIRETWLQGIKQSYYYYIFAVVAFFFYFTRRKERLKSSL